MNETPVNELEILNFKITTLASMLYPVLHAYTSGDPGLRRNLRRVIEILMADLDKVQLIKSEGSIDLEYKPGCDPQERKIIL